MSETQQWLFDVRCNLPASFFVLLRCFPPWRALLPWCALLPWRRACSAPASSASLPLSSCCSASASRQPSRMRPPQTMGYLVIEDVLSQDQVREINALIDGRPTFKSNGHLGSDRDGSGLAGADPGATRHTMSGMLAWDKPLAEPFRELLWHPKLVPVLQTILGDGFRLDNGPLVMSMAPGGGGQNLHGGGFERDLAESYDYRNGRFYTGMCVLEVLLADQPAGAGGLCIVPGSRAPTAAVRACGPA